MFSSSIFIGNLAREVADDIEADLEAGMLIGKLSSFSLFNLFFSMTRTGRGFVDDDSRTRRLLGLGTGMPAGQMAEGEPRRLDLWRDGSNRLSALVRVVPGFLTAEQGATLRWASVAATVGSQVVPVFADLGRIHTGSPSMPVAAAADALVTVCRGDVASVQHLIWRLEQLVPAIAERNGRPPIVMPVVVAARRNGARAASQVAELLAETSVGPTLRGVGWLAWDPTGVGQLQDGANPWAKPLRGSPLMTSALTALGVRDSSY